ncbi:MAG: S26 family signal peptidase [Planctomycetota bacterium]|nr:S26 family signal peptidase [Planctomycetota bacterium]
MLSVVLLALVFARAFVARTYLVTTASMEPTILGARGEHFGGERVLVTFGVGELQRFDLVVVERGGGEAPFVKRVGGMPGERIRLLDGDLLVDGERLAADAPRPPAIELFDSSIDELADSFHFREAPEGAWTRQADGVLSLAGERAPAGSDAGLLLLHKELRDGYRLADGSLDPGTQAANDGGVSVEFRLEEPASLLRARLVEEGDLFELSLGTTETGALELLLVRDPGGEELARVPFTATAEERGDWLRLDFSNIDNHLMAAVSAPSTGKSLVELVATYQANLPYNGILPEDRSSVAARVAVGGASGDLSLRHLRVTRDRLWLPLGTYAVAESLDLGPSEYFLLGDNSADSADSRLWGPVQASSLIGRPRAIVGPWARRRALR